ncbi:hypothetical protein [Diaphorobacter sp.]|uniref:hypothetical protein n=1 Tax=Diaphorobacter sp. TaxID=1934310 RepID=UPI00258B8C14|nr:hypothetical protein [Diaphorobacter sp.]
MKNTHDDSPGASRDHTHIDPGAQKQCPSDAELLAPGMEHGLSTGQTSGCPVPRGLTAQVGTLALQDRIWTRSLLLVDRFRVIRTIDIAVHCFAERPFKAALSAAQRAVRGMVKAQLLARYRTDRFMTVYGLTQVGAQWLEDRGFEASASVRRVTDMTNPEHRLWSQFLTLCAEARGLQAMTEQELLLTLNRDMKHEQSPVQGLLHVTTRSAGKRRHLTLRPDAVAIEPDGIAWYEVDRSARGSDRAASLRALVLSMGAKTTLGQSLRRVVVFSRTSRIHLRVLASLDGLVKDSAAVGLMEGRRQLKLVETGCYEVHQSVEVKLRDGRSQLQDRLAGHVIVQELPVWLPKVRLDGRGDWSMRGWFNENYLPYKRPVVMPPWQRPGSPLLIALHDTG